MHRGTASSRPGETTGCSRSVADRRFEGSPRKQDGRRQKRRSTAMLTARSSRGDELEGQEEQRLCCRAYKKEPGGSGLVMAKAVDEDDVEQRVEGHRDREHPEQRRRALILGAERDPDDEVGKTV